MLTKNVPTGNSGIKNPHCEGTRRIAVSQWGHANQFFQNNRGHDFSIEALRKNYTGDPGWHDTRQVAELKRLYRDEILEIFELHRSRVSICQCRECGIEFLTGRSNAGRADLRCPFGCR